MDSPVAPAAALPDATASAAEVLQRAETMIMSGQGEPALAALDEGWSRLEADGDLSVGIGRHLRAVAHEHAGRLGDAMLSGLQAVALFEQAGALGRLVRTRSIVALILSQLG